MSATDFHHGEVQVAADRGKDRDPPIEAPTGPSSIVTLVAAADGSSSVPTPSWATDTQATYSAKPDQSALSSTLDSDSSLVLLAAVVATTVKDEPSASAPPLEENLRRCPLTIAQVRTQVGILVHICGCHQRRSPSSLSHLLTPLEVIFTSPRTLPSPLGLEAGSRRCQDPAKVGTRSQKLS
jgi:hypothetical protein